MLYNLKEGERNMMIYMDNAATSLYNRDIDNIVVDAITSAMKSLWKNPSSLYASNVKEEIDKCRANVAKFIGASPEEIIFTSGASESNNLAIRGWVDCSKFNDFKMIVSTQTEHKSILELLKSFDNVNSFIRVRYCNTDKYGLIDYNYLKKLLWFHEGEPVLVSISMANNEIGTIQDIKKISDLVHKYNGVLHVDATQALGHIPIDVKELNIDMMSASGHKMSPVLKGIGFLYKKNNINIHPLIYGVQENGLRGGTENTFGIIGLDKAMAHRNISKSQIEDMCKRRDYFIDLLKSNFGCKLNGHEEYRLPNNVNVTFSQDITGESLLYALDASGIQISVGSACNSSSIEYSHVLKAIGVTDEDSMRTVRFTLSDNVSYEDIDYVVDEISKFIKIIES